MNFECTKSPTALLALAAGTTTNHLFQTFHCIDGGRLGQMLSMQGHLHFHNTIPGKEQATLSLAQRMLKLQQRS